MQLKAEDALEEDYIKNAANNEDQGAYYVYAVPAFLDVMFGCTVNSLFGRFSDTAERHFYISPLVFAIVMRVIRL